MAINFRLLRTTAFIFALFAGLIIFAEAQNSSNGVIPGYFLDTHSEEPRFFQRFVWSGGEYTLRYEIIIEKQEGRNYHLYLKEFTKDTFIQVYLPPGHYRFCVIPYDLLDRPGDGTDWVYIDVRHALNPKLIDSSQEIIKEEKKTSLYLDVYADNIDPEAEIFLRASNGRIFSPEEIEFFDDGGFRLAYDGDILKAGEYQVYVRNPGGLESSLGIVYVKPRSKLKINIGAAWMPVFKIFGEKTDWNISIGGGAARISAVYYFPAFFLGPELTTVFQINKNSEQTGQALGLELGLLLGNLMLNNKFALNIRLGAGYSMLLGTGEFTGFFCVTAGVSFFIHITRNFFTEIGIDYSQQFNEGNLGIFRPWLGIGVQF